VPSASAHSGDSKPCSLRASGAIICLMIMCVPAKSATVRAVLAATTRTPSQSLRSIGSSGDCGAGSRRLLSARVTLPLPVVLCAIAAAVWAARDHPRSARYESAAGRHHRSHAPSRLPALNAACGIAVLLIGHGLRLYGNCLVAGMPSPLMNIWDATFKEKGAGGDPDFWVGPFGRRAHDCNCSASTRKKPPAVVRASGFRVQGSLENEAQAAWAPSTASVVRLVASSGICIVIFAIRRANWRKRSRLSRKILLWTAVMSCGVRQRNRLSN
jgi:hypothetical protein